MPSFWCVFSMAMLCPLSYCASPVPLHFVFESVSNYLIFFYLIDWIQNLRNLSSKMLSRNGRKLLYEGRAHQETATLLIRSYAFCTKQKPLTKNYKTILLCHFLNSLTFSSPIVTRGCVFVCECACVLRVWQNHFGRYYTKIDL